MNLPPALTWLQLFPRGANVSCASAPAWLVEMLNKRMDVSPTPTVLAAHEQSWGELGDLSKWDGVVALNCPGVTTGRLEAAGFGYVRRFNAVPGLEKTRWLISLDSPRVAASSFSIYTPARFSARVKKKAASLAARLRLPRWYRDTIVVASRQAPPLEVALKKLFPNENFRLGLSAGAPEPALNRKASAAVLAPDGSVLGFVKIAGSAISRRIMEHEAAVIPALSARVGVAVPKLLLAGEVDGRYVTVQSPLNGSIAPARFTPAHLQFLMSLRNGAVKPASATNMVASLPQRIAALPASHANLTDALERLMPMLEQTRVASTVVHGDFAPWNLRLNHGQIAAFDWEYGELDGLPLIDETHFAIQLGLELGGWDIERAVQYMNDLASRRPMNLKPEQVAALHGAYLLDNIVRLLGEGYSTDHDMVSWYHSLLERIVVPKREAVLA